MPEILRDQIWQFVGAALSIVAILISLYIFVAQQKRKSLTYDVITFTPVLTVKEELQGKIKITYEGKQIQKAYLLVLKVWNDGNIPILPSDFIEPLKFCFRDDIKFLGVEVVDTTPKNLNPQIHVEKNRFTITPLLLNKKDTIVFKFLLSYIDERIGLKAQARIIGINEVGIKPFVYKPYLLTGGLLLFAGIGVYLFILPTRPDTTITIAEVRFLTWAILAIILVVIGLFVMNFPRLKDDLQRRAELNHYIAKSSDEENLRTD